MWLKQEDGAVVLNFILKNKDKIYKVECDNDMNLTAWITISTGIHTDLYKIKVIDRTTVLFEDKFRIANNSTTIHTLLVDCLLKEWEITKEKLLDNLYEHRT